MKKALAILLVVLMMFSFAACDNNGDTDPDNDNSGVSQGGENGDVDSYEQLKLPEGWENYASHAYIDDVWDTSVLPEVLPGPIDGIITSETVYKDNVHAKGDLQVGHLKYEKSEDYRYWEVRFEASKDQFDSYLAALDEKGFVGALDTDISEDDRYTYCYSHSDGYYVYLHYGSYDDGDAEMRSGYMQVTDSVYDYVDSVVGIPLPQFGVPWHDYSINSLQIWSNEEDDYIYEDFDVKNDAFPTDLEDGEIFEIMFDYYGCNLEKAKEYSDQIKASGWEEISYFSENSQNSCYRKDELYLRVIMGNGHEMTVWIGNTDEYYS